MKVCAYCESENVDSATVCSACGASVFKNKCNNCGTVFETAFCPACGTKAGATAKICPRCGERYFTPACPRCGHNDVLNNIQKQSSEASNRVIVQHVTQAEEKPKKKVTFGKILLWIFFLPIMAIVAVWQSKKLATKWKLILSVAIAAVTILFYIVNYADGSNTTGATASKSSGSNAVSRSQTVPVVSEAPRATAAVTEAPKETERVAAPTKPDRKGFKDGTTKYTIQSFSVTVPDYYGTPAQSSTETALHFTNPAERGAILLVCAYEDDSVTKEGFDATVEQSFLNLFREAELTDSKEIKMAGLPGRRMDAAGYYSNVYVRASAAFALDENKHELIGLILMQGDNAQYNYSPDFDKMITLVSVIRQQEKNNKSYSGAVSKDFKKTMDEYEAFIDSYCAFMKKYNASNDISGMTMEYLNMLTKLTEWETKMDDIYKGSLSEADLLYYTEVTVRCANKVLQVSASIGG